MAGHGGGGGGHGGGGGGGGGKKKGGLMAAITGNGCLRYLALYVGALIFLAVLAIANGLGLFSKLGLPVPSAPSVSRTTSVGLPPNAGGSAPSSSTSASGSRSIAAKAGGMISSAPVAAPSGGQITSMTAPAFYIVQPGETIDTVAAKFDMTPQQLYDYNNLNNRMLLAGQVLYLPPPGNPAIPGTGRNAGRTDAAPAAGGGDGTP